jgi:DNA-directed RNA polymerase specialized sigma24 family protein
MEITRKHYGYLVFDDGVEIKFLNLEADKNQVQCDVRARQITPYERTLAISNLNLKAKRSVKELGLYIAEKIYAERWETADKEFIEVWTRAFCDVVEEILNDYLTPPKPKELKPADNPEPTWLIDKLIPLDAPTILYAPGGSGKSFISFFVALCVQNGISFFGRTQQCRTLYLDWEADEFEFQRRLRKITNGLSDTVEITNGYPGYLRMYAPLPEVANYILEITAEEDYKFVIIDSAACALGGDMNDAAVVTKFFNVVRRINTCGITTLIISHISKAEQTNDGKKSPYGSVYFLNFPRLAWELRSKYDAEAREFNVGMFCRKINNSEQIKPFGMKMIFDEDSVTFTKADMEILESIDKRENVTEAILELLQEKPLTAKEVAHELEIDVATAKTLLSRLKKAGKVTSDGYGSKYRLRHRTANQEVDSAPF